MITHVILFLPGETEAQMLKTIDYLNAIPLMGQIAATPHFKGNRLARDYARSPFLFHDMDEYIRCIGNCIDIYARHRHPPAYRGRSKGSAHRTTMDRSKAYCIKPHPPIPEKTGYLAGKGVLWLKLTRYIN